MVRLGLKLKKVRLATPLVRSDSRETSPKTMNREMSLFRNVEAAKRRGIQSAVTHKTQKWFFKKKDLYFGKKLSRFLSFVRTKASLMMNNGRRELESIFDVQGVHVINLLLVSLSRY